MSDDECCRDTDDCCDDTGVSCDGIYFYLVCIAIPKP